MKAGLEQLTARQREVFDLRMEHPEWTPEQLAGGLGGLGVNTVKTYLSQLRAKLGSDCFDAVSDEPSASDRSIAARARAEHEVQGKLLDVLEPLSNEKRMRVLAAAAILSGVVDPRLVLRELR